MNARAIGAELASLTAAALCAYGATAFAVAVLADGGPISIAAPVGAVVLSYGLARSLRALSLSEQAARLGACALSLMALYLILRLEIAGDLRLWDLRWLGDGVLAIARRGDVDAGATVAIAVIGAVWWWGLQRGSSEVTLHRLTGELSSGLVILMLGAAFAPAAGAPDALRWLPITYLPLALIALALANVRSNEAESSRPFLRSYAMWTGGVLAAIAGLAVLASFVHPPSLDSAGNGVAVVGNALLTAVVLVVSPFVVAVAWAVEHIAGWLLGGSELPDPPAVDEAPPILPEEDQDPGTWAGVIGTVVRSAVLGAALATAMTLLWLATRRRRSRGEDEVAAREAVEGVPGRPLGSLQSLLSGALAHLPIPHRRGPRDPVGRLYVSVLRQSAAQGLARPLAATPLEFAPALRAHWGSPVVEAISRAYSESRYGGLRHGREEVEGLRSEWEVLARRERGGFA
jgi:hypothetical protein